MRTSCSGVTGTLHAPSGLNFWNTNYTVAEDREGKQASYILEQKSVCDDVARTVRAEPKRQKHDILACPFFLPIKNYKGRRVE
jgi:hypothetical protein